MCILSECKCFDGFLKDVAQFDDSTYKYIDILYIIEKVLLLL